MASDSPHRSSRRSPSPKKRSDSRDRSRRQYRSRSRSPRQEKSRRHDGHSRSSHHRSSRHDRSKSPQRSESRHKSKRHRDSSRKYHRSSRHKRRDSSVSSISSSDSEYERKKREHRKHKKDKKHKKSKKSKLSVGDQWGQHGIIHEADIFTKEPEFQAWLIEVKNANVETLSNNKRKEMFADFMEDYNTATMPHEKFYNLEKWERRQEAIRMGETIPVSTNTFNFREDEEKLKAQHRLSRQSTSSRQPSLKLSQEQIEELTRINRERVEADRMRKMGLKPKESMGVRYEYEEI